MVVVSSKILQPLPVLALEESDQNRYDYIVCVNCHKLILTGDSRFEVSQNLLIHTACVSATPAGKFNGLKW